MEIYLKGLKDYFKKRVFIITKVIKTKTYPTKVYNQINIFMKMLANMYIVKI